MERGKITVAPFALGRAWELTLFKNWVKLANTNDKNFDRSDILITGGTANIHLVLRLPQNCVHSTIHNRSKKNPQNLQIEPTHNDSPLPCRFSSLTPSLNKSEVMSFSFQNTNDKGKKPHVFAFLASYSGTTDFTNYCSKSFTEFYISWQGSNSKQTANALSS